MLQSLCAGFATASQTDTVRAWGLTIMQDADCAASSTAAEELSSGLLVHPIQQVPEILPGHVHQ